MSYKAWNVIHDKVLIPDATNGTNSRPFSIPKGAKMMTIFVPDLVGVGTTLLVQALQPQDQEGQSETWVAVGCFDLTDGTIEALDAIPESAATTLPITATGGGILRFVASAAQTGAADALTIYITYAMDE